MENTNKTYTVIVSENAANMLVSHAKFLANASLKAAQKLIKEFKTCARSLEELPDRNSWLFDTTMPINKYRKLLMSRQYLIIYQIKGNKVFIDYIVDCRQDYKWLL